VTSAIVLCWYLLTSFYRSSPSTVCSRRCSRNASRSSQKRRGSTRLAGSDLAASLSFTPTLLHLSLSTKLVPLSDTRNRHRTYEPHRLQVEGLYSTWSAILSPRAPWWVEDRVEPDQSTLRSFHMGQNRNHSQLSELSMTIDRENRRRWSPQRSIPPGSPCCSRNSCELLDLLLTDTLQ
jgi:hypothetical protein